MTSMNIYHAQPIPERRYPEDGWGGDKCFRGLFRMFFPFLEGFQFTWGGCPWETASETRNCSLGLSRSWPESPGKIIKGFFAVRNNPEFLVW